MKSKTFDETENSSQAWQFQGGESFPNGLNLAINHLYRGEINRSNTWRTRLDSTTNWAVVTTAALLTFTFGGVGNHHVVLLLGIILNSFFLIIEARRYRYYELWAYRVRLMETDFYGAMLAPPYAPAKDWAKKLNESLLTPQFPISQLEAIGRRLRHNYLGLYALILVSWIIKLTVHPITVQTYAQFLQRAELGPIPGSVIIISVVCFYIAILLVATLTAGLRDAPGEVTPRYEILDFSGNLWSKVWHSKPNKHLVIIITDQGQTVAGQILERLNRGVTALDGTGMYTGEQHSVLLSAVEATEIAYLKSIVYAVDEDAFVVVNATEDVIGRKFSHLQPNWRKSPEEKGIKNE